MRKSISVYLTIGLIVALFLFSFNGLAQQEKSGGTLKIVVGGSMGSLNPITSDWIPGYSQLIYGGLVSRDFDFEYQDYAIKSWEVSDDGLEWKLHLKEGVKFHNGQEFTAQVLSDWLEVLREGSGSSDWENVTEIEPLDKHTALVKMKDTTPTFLYTLVNEFSTPISTEYWDEVGGKEGYGYDKICGFGPYKVVDRPSQYKIILEKFEEFDWGPSWWENQGPGYVDRIEITYIKESSTRIARLQANEADIIWSGVPAHRLSDLEKDEDVKVVESSSSSVKYMGLDLASPKLEDTRVRRAINLAIDRESLGKVVYDGIGKPAHQFLRRFVPASNIPDEFLSRHDPEKAKELMKEAGHEDGFTLRTMIVDESDIKKLATTLQAQLESTINVKLDIKTYDEDTFFAKREAHEGYDASVFSYAYSTAGIFHWFFHSSMKPSPNYLSVDNEFVDLIDESARTAPNPEIHHAYYKLLNKGMQKIVIPYAPLWHPVTLGAYRKDRVDGWKTLTLGGAPITDLWIPADARK